MEGSPPIIEIREHEGTVFYSDGTIQNHAVIAAVVIVETMPTVPGLQSNINSRQIGHPAITASLIARYLHGNRDVLPVVMGWLDALKKAP